MTYASPDALLEDVQLTLENDVRWYRWCTNKYRDNLETMDAMSWHKSLCYFYRPAVDLCLDQRQYLGKYFKWRYQTDQTTPPPEYTAGGLKVPVPATLYPPKEKSMSLKFQTVYLLNGNDVSQLTKEQVYTAIEGEEQRIEKLRKIKHQPKSLVAEIEQAEAALNALVAYLDAN